MPLTKVTYSMIEGATVNVFDYIPQSEHAAIQAGTSTYDCTADIAQAIANCSAAQGDPYGYEKVIVFPEGLYNVHYIDLTARRDVWMWAEGYVQIKGIDSATKNFIFGSTNYNSVNPAASTQTTNCFLGGPGHWEFLSAPGTSYQYGMRLEHFTVSRFEKVSAGYGYVEVTDTNGVTGSVVAAYLQYTYSNLFIDCNFPCPAAPPVGGKSFGLFMDNNNVNSNTFLRCNWQGAGATSAPYSDTIGAWINGSNNVIDQCDFSGLATAIVGQGRGGQIRNVYSEYVTTFFSGPAVGTSDGYVVQGGIIEIVNNGQAFYPENTQNLTIIGGFYKGALAGTKTFIDQTAGTLYGLNCIGVYLNPGDFANTTSGTYRNPDALAYQSVLQAKWLTFPSTQQPSTDANTLDDYAEGTFDFGISFGGGSTGITYTNKQGSYTKIGNRVLVSGQIILSNKGSSTGNARITGLPFTVANNANAYSAAALSLTNITFADVPSGYGELNATTIALVETTNAGTVTNLTDADFANNSSIIVSLCYSAA